MLLRPYKSRSFRRNLRGVLGAWLLILFCAFVQAQEVKYSSRVLLIPLDDRPPCLQFPVKMGLVGDVEVVTPPRELLGRFTDFGKSDEIVAWIRKQNLNGFDAAIVSVDMLAYGGLVASRVYETSSKEALRRVHVVTEMRRKAPRLKIYGSSVIMRLAPTADGNNDAYREKLAKWAEVSDDIAEKAETTRLENETPTDALKNYKLARARNLELNRHAVELTQKRVFDYLILSQDDAKPRGVHVKDRESLIAQIAAEKLGDRVAVQPGADEVSMLLLSRAVTDKYNYHPKIKAVYSSEKLADQVMPFEDRPLRKTVSFHIKAAGGIEVPKETNDFETNVSFLIYASRFEIEGPQKFLSLAAKGKNAVIADIDPKGDIQGADIVLTEKLLEAGYFPLLSGYASWNTAGNTIGTAIPQGILIGAANYNYFGVNGFKKFQKKRTSKENLALFDRVAFASDWFIMHRLLDDYLYHSVVRPKALQLIRDKKWNSFRLTDEQTQVVEEFCLKEIKRLADATARNFFGPDGKRICSISGLTFDLPWNRTFEAEIDFRLSCPTKEETKRNEKSITLIDDIVR